MKKNVVLKISLETTKIVSDGKIKEGININGENL